VVASAAAGGGGPPGWFKMLLGSGATSPVSQARAALRESGSTLPMGPPLYIETSSRVVAIGDLHGDMEQGIRALRLAGAVSPDATKPEDCHWVAGDMHLVQLGDILDRGDDEISLLLLLRKLEEEAEAAGGAIHFINGNHEVLNVAGDFRYVTEGAMRESEEFHGRLVESFGGTMALLGVPCDMVSVCSTAKWSGEESGPEYQRYRCRVELFAPGGPIALQFAQHHAVLVINDTLFTHGGVSTTHTEIGLDNLNRSVSAWMRGGGLPAELEDALFHATGSGDSLVWNRTWGKTTEYMRNYQKRVSRGEMTKILEATSLEVGREVKRLVIGHTVQPRGANVEFDGRAWRMDVGASRGVKGAAPEVLEIVPGEEPRIIKFPPGQDGSVEVSEAATCEEVDTEFAPLSCNLFDHALLLRSPMPVASAKPSQPAETPAEAAPAAASK